MTGGVSLMPPRLYHDHPDGDGVIWLLYGGLRFAIQPRRSFQTEHANQGGEGKQIGLPIWANPVQY